MTDKLVKHIAAVTLLVDDYDRALAFYCGTLGFLCRADVDMGEGKRWVVVAPAVGGAGLLLVKAESDAQTAAIGNQAVGRVAFFLHTDDFSRDHAAFLAKDVQFHEEPRFEAYGTVAVFADLYGNLWDLIEPKA
jgi:catechol 2,3-dioxygenase-like lactoylglutathione lyase family enzyme